MGNEQLQKTNNLYLSLRELEDSVRPLLDDYRHASFKFNETVARVIDQFNQVLGRIEEVEVKKTRKIKAAVCRYVRTNKANLDEVLERYPFLCEEIDRMREAEEFTPHSCEGLIRELEALDRPIYGTDYIDAIYDRMEVRKSLEDMILYGVPFPSLSRTQTTRRASLACLPQGSSRTRRILAVYPSWNPRRGGWWRYSRASSSRSRQ